MSQTPAYVIENKVRLDANRIALNAARAILDAAEPFEVTIEGKRIRVEPQRLPAKPWPVGTWGLDEEQDGPWPQPVLFDCAWEGGKTRIVASVERASGSYRDLVCLMFSVYLTRQRLVWINIAALLRKDARHTMQYGASCSLFTRIPDDLVEKQRRERRMAALRILVGRSGLLISAGSDVDAFAITLPEGHVQQPGMALRRLTHLALLKLPFLMKEQSGAIEGSFYVDPDDPKLLGSDAERAIGMATKMDVKDAEGNADASSLDEPEATDAAPTPTDGPARWLDPRLGLKPEQVRPLIEARRIEVSDSLIAQLCAALSSGKHLLLVGPPGTGKTEIASALGHGARDAGYSNGVFVATASADWSTFDTIGGYTMEKDGRFAFRSGVFLRAIEGRKWLLLDEVNRGDIDRSFGELMTVLAGGRTDTPYTQPNGTAISIGPGTGDSHHVPPTFRVLATMNTWDKTSLFRLSYAVQRRFAIVHVGPPSDETYARILESQAREGDADPPLQDDALARMQRLFRTTGLLRHRSLGPAIAIDMVRYQRCRQAGGDGFVEAIGLFLLPQLEGLDTDAAAKVYGVLTDQLAGWASDEARADLRVRFRELFPAVTLPST